VPVEMRHASSLNTSPLKSYSKLSVALSIENNPEKKNQNQIKSETKKKQNLFHLKMQQLGINTMKCLLV